MVNKIEVLRWWRREEERRAEAEGAGDATATVGK
jgi:hypothetical protein